MKKDVLVPHEVITDRIYLIRGQKVMLDKDLALLYRIQTRYLKRAVRRNIKRFPSDFMFVLNDEEMNAMGCQFGTPPNILFGGYKPFAFTEHGILMLSSVLSSEQAVQINILIMRAFIKLRNLLATHKELAHNLGQLEEKVGKHDKQIMALFEAIHQLMEPPPKPIRKIGFIQDKE